METIPYQQKPLHQFRSDVSVELLGPPGLNSFIPYDSSSRVQMFCSHLGQTLNVAGASKKRIVSGIEREFGKYAFAVRMPIDATILKVIPRYPYSVAEDAIRENPEVLVIYEDFDTKLVNCLTLPNYHSIHKDFGFRYVKRNYDKLVPGANVKKGTYFAQAPSVDDQGNYRYGAEMNVAFMSIPQIIEDGVVISRSAAKMLTTKAFGKRVVKWGKKHYPLNTYPDGSRYKPFPDIGEYIRPDGLLTALRTHDASLAPVEMTTEALQTPDYIYDKLTYAEPNARVIDVKVWSERSGKQMTPYGMGVQADRYASALSTYYKSILDEYERLKRRDSRNFKIGDAFQRMVTEAIADSGMVGKDRVQKTYRMQPLDEYRVEITYEYDLVPTVGFKLTGCHGNKGVVCAVWEDEWMPVDAHGNRAHIIMDGHSVTKRMNPGVFYEHYINGASRDVSERVRMMFGLDRVAPSTSDIQSAIQNTDIVNAAYEFLYDYYKYLSPRMMSRLDTFTQEQKRKHVECVLREGVYIYLPPDNELKLEESIDLIDQHYPQIHSPVTYRGTSGNLVTTVKNVYIATCYILLLEKTGENWAAVASARLQHFGIPAKLTNEDKNAAPGRQQPVRTLGESEIRLLQAVIGSYATADQLDQSTNPTIHKEIVRCIVRSPGNPNSIERVIDRKRYPIGNGRPLVYYRHVMECGGVRYVRRTGGVN